MHRHLVKCKMSIVSKWLTLIRLESEKCATPNFRKTVALGKVTVFRDLGVGNATLSGKI